MSVGRDPRATVVARERVEGMAGEYGVDLIIWGKALEEVGREASEGPLIAMLLYGLEIDCSSDNISEDDQTSSLLNLNPALLRPFPSLPDPSSLFCTQQSTEEYDAITFLPLAGRTARCNRCGWRTAALGTSGVVGDGEVLRGWRKWKSDREGGCGCGGCWVADKGVR